MKRASAYIANLVICAFIVGANLAQAQSASTKASSQSATLVREFQLISLLAQARPAKPAGFSLMPANRLANPALSLTSAAANPVIGNGNAGRIARWTGVEGSNTYVLGNSTIFEDKFGKVGIGTDTPTSRFTVAGLIETNSGGVKFPDGTVQTTAGVAPNDVVRSLNGLKGDLLLAGGANITVSSVGNTITVAAPNVLTSVAHNATLTGNGTAASPLSVVQSEAQIEPVGQSATVELTTQFTGSGDIYTVPAGKRLVIGQISARCFVPLGQKVVELSIGHNPLSSFVMHQLIPVFNGGTGATNDIYAADQLMKSYAAPNTTVVVGLARNSNSGTCTCRFDLTGFLVTLP